MAAISAVPVAAGVFLWLPQLAVGAILGVAGTAVAVAAVDRWQVEAPSMKAAKGQAAKGQAAKGRAAAPGATTSKPVLAEPGPAPTETPVAPSAPEPSARSTIPSAGRDLALPMRSTLDQELALLEEARRLLASDAAGAFRVLQAHETRFASGQLRIEREFLAVETLVRLGRGQEAELRARALEVQAPRTIYGERLDRILGRSRR